MSYRYAFDSVALRPDVRIFDQSPEIRFRIGVWNYEEAVLSFEDQDRAVYESVHTCLERLTEHGALSMADIDGLPTDSEAKERVNEIFGQLKEAGYLTEADTFDRELADRIFLGGLVPEELRREAKPGKVLLISDGSEPAEAIQSAAAALSMPIEELPEAERKRIELLDLYSGVETMKQRREIASISAEWSDVGYVIFALSALRVRLLRNVNRILFHERTPSTLAYVDGPFAGVASFFPPESACFECYEQRSIARIEDHVAYHRFVETEASWRTAGRDSKRSLYSPVLTILGTLAATEAFTYQSAGASKLVGRALSIYVPTLEIQFQDVLRVAYCPCCGHVSTTIVKDMNTQADTIIQDIISNARNGGSK